MKPRRKARAALLRALYLAESRGISAEAAIAEMEQADRDMSADHDDDDLAPFGAGLDESQREFVLRLAREIREKRDIWNERIARALVNWDFSRVARIDRMIMWIALAEMSAMRDIPVRVSIDEALELAKTYSSPKSPKFINGVLDRVARDLEYLPPDSSPAPGR